MIDLTHYSKEVEIINDFSLWKSNVTKYCETDCVSLYQIMIQFLPRGPELVFSKWNLFIEFYPTTASLSFGLFRKHYLNEFEIPIYKGKVFEFLRQSFSGGSTEMYKPYLEILTVMMLILYTQVKWLIIIFQLVLHINL